MIRCRAVHKRFGARRALDGVDLDARPGTVVVVGRSGSGKSTWLRCLAGFERIDEGELWVAGHDLSQGAPRALRRDVGMVFQDHQLFGHLSVRENLLLAPRVVLGETRESSEARAAELLERLGVLEQRDSRPGQLSGGEKQRVAIARALMLSPKVLLFDEPTSALDPVRTADVALLLRELAADGTLLVVVTHSMHLARMLGGELVVMDHGRVVESGSSSQVLGAPRHPATQGLLRDT